MNVLIKTKKFFPGPIKTSDSKVIRHLLFQIFLAEWNILLSNSTESEYDDLFQKMKAKHPTKAMSYLEGTWLY
jgi:hypothetical protein